MADEVLQFGNVNDSAQNNPQGFRNWLKGADVTYMNEFGNSFRIAAELGELFFSPVDEPTDPAVLVRGGQRFKVRDEYEQLTRFIERPGSDKPRLWRDRRLVRLSRPGRRRDYVTHLNAATQDNGRWLANPGAEANIKAMRRLYDMLKLDMKAGWSVRVAMDANINDKHPEEPWTPAWVFRELGLRYINTDVCYIAWDPKREEAVMSRDGKPVPGSDGHGTLYVTLRRRPWYKRWLVALREKRKS